MYNLVTENIKRFISNKIVSCSQTCDLKKDFTEFLWDRCRIMSHKAGSSYYCDKPMDILQMHRHRQGPAKAKKQLKKQECHTRGQHQY